MVKVALVISALDPLNGAGFTLDLRVIEEFGIKAVGVPTGILPQDPQGVREAFFFPRPWVERALEPLLALRPLGIKASILGNFLENIRVLLQKIKGPKILDPIIWPGGKRVVRTGDLRKVIPLFDLVTPNIPEAEEILGVKAHPSVLCQKFMAEFGVSTLLKGGHSKEKADFLCVKGGIREFPPEKIFPYEVHGTGCLLSSAILALWLSGHSLEESVVRARTYLFSRYEKSLKLGPGKRIFS